MQAVITIGGKSEPEDDEDDVIKPLPERLISELTTYRTLARSITNVWITPNRGRLF